MICHLFVDHPSMSQLREHIRDAQEVYMLRGHVLVICSHALLS